MSRMGGLLLQLLGVLMPFLAVVSSTTVAKSNVTILPNCPESCGNVSIPYPFGIGPGCFRHGFEVTCDQYDVPFLGDSRNRIEIISILLLTSHARVYEPVATYCLPWSSGGSTIIPYDSLTPDARMDLRGTPYVFSDTHNIFMVVGCNAIGYIKNGENELMSGCLSVCGSGHDVIAGECSGIACCQSAVPKGLQFYSTNFSIFSNFTSPASNCSYSVIADHDWFKIYEPRVYLNYSRIAYTSATVTLDWAIRDHATCQEAQRDQKTYACLSAHSRCVETANGTGGYICNCSSGFEGNPYLVGGCQDINECDYPNSYPCRGVCINTPGSYNCSCPQGTYGDAVLGKCFEYQQSKQSKRIIIGTVSGIVCLSLLGFSAFIVLERRKLKKIKDKHFEQNGGWQLLDKMKSKQGHAFKIFTIEELDEATNKFDKDQVIGRGGNGTVYKGILKDHRVVAIKRSKIIDDERQKKEFGNEMIILSQINHKNIVKLLGCCLEVETPMLVYEYVPNGTLFHLIHGEGKKYPVSLGTRLKIASESAEALAYLHSAASPPIVHGDVKSSNILLDNGYMAKVSDFGTSKVVPKDETQFATLVQGTYGYLDPEYLQTGQVNEKSDVYSFGVVMLELLTGKKAVYFEGSEEERILASLFISAMKEDRLSDILENEIRIEGVLELIQEVAEISMCCLQVKGDERPTMKEVAEKLQWLRRVVEGEI